MLSGEKQIASCKGDLLKMLANNAGSNRGKIIIFTEIKAPYVN